MVLNEIAFGIFCSTSKKLCCHDFFKNEMFRNL